MQDPDDLIPGQGEVEMPEGLRRLMLPASQTAIPGVPLPLTYTEIGEVSPAQEEEWERVDAFAPHRSVGIEALFEVVGPEEGVIPYSNLDLPTEYQRTNPKWVLMCQLRASGGTLVDIARALNMTPQAIWIRLRDPRLEALTAFFLGRVVEKTDAVNDLIRQTALTAAFQLVKTLNNEGANDDVRMRAAIRILDMAGHKPVERKEIELNNTFIQPADLERMKRADELMAEVLGSDA